MVNIEIGIPGIFNFDMDITPRIFFLGLAYTCFSFVLALLNEWGFLPKGWYNYVYVITLPVSILISLANLLLVPLSGYLSTNTLNTSLSGTAAPGCVSQSRLYQCPASMTLHWWESALDWITGGGWSAPWQCAGHEGAQITYDPCALEPTTASGSVFS